MGPRRLKEMETNIVDPFENAVPDYEHERQKILEERKRFLKSIDIDEAKRDLKVNSSRVVLTKRIKKEKIELPRRESLRLKNKPSPKEDPSVNIKEDPSVNIKEEEEEYVDERILSSENMKLDKKGADLTDILKKFRSGLKEDCHFDHDLCLESCGFNVFNESLLCFCLNGNPTKVTSHRIQSLCFHPATSKKLVLAGSTSGSLGIWDAGESAPPLELHPHKAPTNCITVCKSDPCRVFTTSHDGTVLSADIEKATFTNIYYKMDMYERSNHLTWHEEVDDGSGLLVAAGSGEVLFLDPRSHNESPEYTIPCFERSVRTVHSHPINLNYFIASSGTGGCVILDRRWISSKKKIINTSVNSATSLLEMRHSKGLTSAFFSPRGNYALTTCNDDRLRVYDVHGLSGATPTVKSSTAHNNHTGRWLSVFKAHWWPGRDDAFVVGSLCRPRKIEIFESEKCKLMGEFKDEERLTTVLPVISFHPTLPILAGGNSSGKVHLFSPTSL